MATTTPNFGWSVPTSSDLVKNGATAIETLGDAIDASLVDLKGGTTGQVLAKASDTDMDFTWAADAGAPTSLGYAAGKNKIINGDFFVNQRNFTSSTTFGVYGFDRWRMDNVGGTCTYSAQTFTPGTAPVAGYEGRNYARIVTVSQSAAGDYCTLIQPIEDVRTFAGQTITVSFWAKANTGTPQIGIEMLQEFGAGGSPSAGVSTPAGAITLSTAWARYTITVAIPSLSGKTIGTTANTSSLYLILWQSSGATFATRASSIGIQNNTFEFWGVQVEAGSVATAFQTATGTIQGELAACQRYYWRGSAAENFAVYGSGSASSTTAVEILVPILQTMRVKPTSVDYASLFLSDGSGSPAISSITIAAYTTNTVRLNTATTGATQFRPYSLMNAGTSAGYLAFNAEL